MLNKIRFLAVLSMLASLLAGSQAVLATTSSRDEDQRMLEEIVLTGMRVSQGGAQDINFFRGEVEQNRIPHPNDFTAEGLFGEHDIVLPAISQCLQLFCLTGETMRANLMVEPQARYLVGVGFASNIDASKWRRDPINLIAVVDKSGSMDGQPLELVRQSLIEVAKQLHEGDQMSIVLYGDTSHVHLKTTPVTANSRGRIIASIRGIQSSGSTSMEAGLTLGYKVARETAPAFHGRTRLMLFTDERPNTDATDAESFMGMAIEASHRGVGLTTVGVGIQFGAELATKIGSVRGGNLYFIRDEADVHALYQGQLDFMGSELAHDLTLTLAPAPHWKIAGVYGIPGSLLGWQGESVVQVTIPTVFLDSKGGGIFFTLVPDETAEFLPERPLAADAALANVSVTYRPAVGETTEVGKDSIALLPPAGKASAGMALGHLLVDEFTVLHKAVSAHYIQNDQETAYQLVRAYNARLKTAPAEEMKNERELVGSIEDQFAFLSGHQSESVRPRNFVQLWGKWKIQSIEGGITDLKKGETLQFTPENEFQVFGRDADQARESEQYKSNNNQVQLVDSELVFDYTISPRFLKLTHRRTGVRIVLTRAG